MRPGFQSRFSRVIGALVASWGLLLSLDYLLGQGRDRYLPSVLVIPSVPVVVLAIPRGKRLRGGITIGIIGFIAFNILRPQILATGGIEGNESSVVEVLSTICSAQETFKAADAKDQDGDGVSEYGTLAELAGVIPPKGMTEPMYPSLIDVDMGLYPEKVRRGYRFALFIGGDACGGLTGVDGDEVAYFATAWPDRYKQTGLRTFCVDECGFIRARRNGGRAATCNAVSERDGWPCYLKKEGLLDRLHLAWLRLPR